MKRLSEGKESEGPNKVAKEEGSSTQPVALLYGRFALVDFFSTADAVDNIFETNIFPNKYIRSLASQSRVMS